MVPKRIFADLVPPMSVTELLACLAISLALVTVLTYFFGHDVFLAVQSELAKRPAP
jgi:hypothetical protein